ncbi:uncharacterized protein BX663DRAFT_469940 [Cokeromyces recurvatus]|uniref:uncharacterized protein n=1 Tax=Cokeromyces recurvatus TaxID=90255 RepID=UPI0022212720|nr:uncharacterized protein BX663DRAFT_469940 [Cokeromyces recurvatus]KAI7904845.1 hypothetical protein BX663DRAFT_469940 [Cokeromyces recurvatus]
MSITINAIDKESIHKICSGQVVLDLATAVKELVENSIDAGATSIDVNFKESGIERIEVIDDGSGIDPANYETLALKHYTSKLNSFEDLEKVLTFGFRGEALSSLCALSQLTVITATKDQAPMGIKLEYDRNGILISKTPVSRTNGTTIQLSNIFHSLPVRLQEFKRNIKREYSKALTFLQAYSIISVNTRISVSNQTGKRPSMKIMSTTKNKEISANISNIFGAKLASQIIPFKVDLEPVLGKEGSLEGYISKPEWGLGRNSSDRQYFYINGRPCILSKMAKTFNEIYRIFISNQYPVVIANFKIPTDAYDVNVSPDKRTIFIHQEAKIVDAIMNQLKEQLEPSRSTFQINALMSLATSNETPISETKNHNNADDEQSNIISPLRNTVNNLSLLSSSPAPALRSLPSLKSFTNSGSITRKNNNESISKYNKPISIKRSYGTSTATINPYISKKSKIDSVIDIDNAEEDKMEDVETSDTSLLKMQTTKAPEVDTKIEEMEFDTREYVETVTGIKSYSGLWKTVGRILTIKSNTCFDYLKENSNTIEENSSFISTSETIENAGITNTADNEKATRALSRVIHKPDFARMKVIGQFNLGFIITILDNQDLYIIDQHASDEKYNFEILQRTTQIKGQKLISSHVLDLTAAEEHIVMDNLDIFKANGFDVQVLPDNEPTKRICVISQPVSKNTMFDKKDFSEIIFLINEHPGEMVRCSRNRAMFASRACHKAARIGDSLNKSQMIKIVQHMGEIDQPWNCPHGRPTMRHLLSLSHHKQLHTKQKHTLSFTGTIPLFKE